MKNLTVTLADPCSKIRVIPPLIIKKDVTLLKELNDQYIDITPTMDPQFIPYCTFDVSVTDTFNNLPDPSGKFIQFAGLS